MNVRETYLMRDTVYFISLSILHSFLILELMIIIIILYQGNIDISLFVTDVNDNAPQFTSPSEVNIPEVKFVLIEVINRQLYLNHLTVSVLRYRPHAVFTCSYSTFHRHNHKKFPLV